MGLATVLADIRIERLRQDEKWGDQSHHPHGTGGESARHVAEMARSVCEQKFNNGIGSWKDILNEEVCEAFAEENPDELRKELIQVAAVAVAWVEKIDRESEALTRTGPAWHNTITPDTDTQ